MPGSFGEVQRIWEVQGEVREFQGNSVQIGRVLCGIQWEFLGSLGSLRGFSGEAEIWAVVAIWDLKRFCANRQHGLGDPYI